LSIALARSRRLDSTGPTPCRCHGAVNAVKPIRCFADAITSGAAPGQADPHPLKELVKTKSGGVYFTDPEVSPFTIYRSRKIPMMISGRMAAEDSAAIDHHEMPCEPVWLATITGNVLA